jgi:hypothetical protein
MGGLTRSHEHWCSLLRTRPDMFARWRKELGRQKRNACLVVVLSSALASCGQGMTFVMQQYGGPARPRNSVAAIRVNAAHGPDLIAVDGVPFGPTPALEPGNRLHLEVLPGPHEVDVVATDPATGLNREIPVRFVAEPGKVYRVELATNAVAHSEATPEAYAYEVDRDTDATIRIATAAPARPVAPLGSWLARDAGGAPADTDLDSAADGATADGTDAPTR